MKSKKIKSKKPKNLIKDSSSSTKTKFIIEILFLFTLTISILLNFTLFIIVLLQDGMHPVDKIIFLAFTVFVICTLFIGLKDEKQKDKK